MELINNFVDEIKTNKVMDGTAGKVESVFKRVNKLGKKADNFAHGIREHGMQTSFVFLNQFPFM